VQASIWRSSGASVRNILNVRHRTFPVFLPSSIPNLIQIEACLSELLFSMLQLLFSNPIIFVLWIMVFIGSLSFHEYAHARMSAWLGDDTARRLGRLTVDPRSHIDPLGLASTLLIGFGWGKPVPFNPYNLVWRRWGPAVVAAAGTLSNILLALISGLLLFIFGSRLGCDNLLVIFLTIAVQLNVVLMAFNLIPLPPLDGSKALIALLAHPKYLAIRTLIETQGQTLLFFLLIVDAFSNVGIFSGVFSLAFRVVGLLLSTSACFAL
jgi:Zn-dependent protease